MALTTVVNSASQSRTLAHDLHEIGVDLASSRNLLHQITLRDIRIRYKQAIMGFGWALFMPILIVLSGMVVRLAMATLSHSPLAPDTIVTMAVKSLPWAFFVGAINFAVTSLTANGNLIGKIYFPREVLPISAVLAQAFDTGIGMAGVALVLPFLGVTAHWSLLWVPVLLLMLFSFTAGISLFLSAANVFFRDVKYIVQVILTFGIFFTPILYEPVMLGPTGAFFVMLNPLAPIVEGLRLSIVQGWNLMDPLVATSGGQAFVVWSPWHLVLGLFWSVLFPMSAAILFHRAEFKFAELA